eukprot:UN01836
MSLKISFTFLFFTTRCDTKNKNPTTIDPPTEIKNNTSYSPLPSSLLPSHPYPLYCLTMIQLLLLFFIIIIIILVIILLLLPFFLIFSSNYTLYFLFKTSPSLHPPLSLSHTTEVCKTQSEYHHIYNVNRPG